MKYVPGMDEGYANSLKNKLFGLLGREWEKFLDSILTELMGFDIDERTINYYVLFHKISSLKYLRYEYFRSTIFDCMTLLSRQQEAEDGIL